MICDEMKKRGYPLLIASMLVVLVFELWQIKTDFDEKKNNMLGGTLVEKEEDDSLLGGFIDNLSGGTLLDARDVQKEGTVKEDSSETVKAEEEHIPPWENEKLELSIGPATDDYFDDALFLGDSRMVGMRDYSGLDNATFYTSVGLNVYDLFKKEYIILDDDSGKVDLETALKARQFGKIYIMVGLNELGRDSDEGYGRAYAEAITKIRELQPDAIIFVHSILKVSAAKSRKDKVFKNERIDVRNAVISSVTNGQDIFWLDINEVFDDGNGNLDKKYTGDDIHLYARYYSLWTDYLRERGVWYIEKTE